MGLQFVIGQSGSGKSHYLYKKIIKKSMEHESENFIFIVPEQSTLQTEMELVKRHEWGGIMNIEVLSFARLAYNIMEETGTLNLPTLDDLGKSLLIRKVANDTKDDFKVIGNELKKNGYINEVKSVISEFMQYGIAPENIEKMEGMFENRKLLQYKLQDIKKVYQSFEEYRKEKYITAEELLKALATIIEKSEKIKNSTIVLDGYTGFTPVQMDVLEKLLLHARKVMVTVTLGYGEDLEKQGKPYELFYMSKVMVQTLCKVAEEQGIPREEDIHLQAKEVKRYENNPPMAFLEQNFFRYQKKTYGKPQEAISVHAAVNPCEELEFCAREIVKLTRKGYYYKDMAIIAGDTEEYMGYIEKIFAKYDIPVFIDAKRPLMNNVLIEFIRAALEVVMQDFKYENVFRFLKTGFHDFSWEDIDILENYVRGNGIRGIKKYREKWVRPLKNMDAEQLEYINSLREKFLLFFTAGDFYKCMRSKLKSVTDKTVCLYHFLEQFEVTKRLVEYEEFFESQGNPSLAKEYHQVYEKVMQVLEEMVELLGEECISIEDYRDILEAGVGEVRIGVIPAGTDVVTIGELERSRLEHVKVLFVVGVNDGKIPKKASNKGVFSELEREAMYQNEIMLAPTVKEQSFMQRFYLYMQLTKPKDYLYLSYAKMNQKGESIRPSYLIQTFLKMYSGLSVIEENSQELKDYLYTPENALSFLADGYAAYREDEESLTWQALYQWYTEQEKYQGVIERFNQACFYGNYETEIGKAAAHALYGTTLTNSVTRLEKYAQCSYAHFLLYGLQLKEREEYKFAEVDLGNVLHLALELFSKRMEESSYSWFDIPEEIMEDWADKAMEESVIQYGNTVLFQTERDKYKMHRAKQLMQTTVATLSTQLRKGKFVPKNYELGFSVATSMEEVTISLSAEEKLKLKGRIDRVDTFEDENQVYVKIIDYKSGNTTFNIAALYHGLQLQLVLYMDAAIKSIQKGTDKKVTPAGIFYYNIDNPMVDGEPGDTQETIDKKIREKLRMNGLVNDSEEVIGLLDAEFEKKSEVIPVTKNKDGSMAKASKVVEEQDFSLLMDFVNKKIVNLGQGILSGDVSIQPYEMDKKTACDYCKLKGVCGFDKKLPGYQFKKLQKFSEEEVLEKIRGEENGDELYGGPAKSH
ncbi:MAG: helicase-exonuclease AddAB subunit AddB [Lachnospiraceae bacterium]|nr:helicase-exonuclease AddAB subunit AddB [Lachnospiraceae bacterium]